MKPQEIAQMLGCSIEQLKQQYEANAKELQEMANKARESKSGVYRNQTFQEWQANADKYKKLAEEI